MADLEERVQIISDEIKVLDSIFCGNDEFLVNGNGLDTDIVSTCRKLVKGEIENLQLSVKIPSENDVVARLGVALSKDYPHTLPEISVLSTRLTRKTAAEIQEALGVYAKESTAQFAEPIVLKLVEWLQIKLAEICLPPEVEVNTINTSEDDKMYVCVIKLDHMRSRKKYLKTISNWIKELHLNGCVLFLEKYIFEVIEGPKSHINEYLKRMRTCTVDIDSAGRACKERMMDVLCQVQNSTQKSFAGGFQILECTSLEEFKQLFHKHGLSDIYQSYVKQHIIEKYSKITQ